MSVVIANMGLIVRARGRVDRLDDARRPKSRKRYTKNTKKSHEEPEAEKADQEYRANLPASSVLCVADYDAGRAIIAGMFLLVNAFPSWLSFVFFVFFVVQSFDFQH